MVPAEVGVVHARVGGADVARHLGEDAVRTLGDAVPHTPGDDTDDPAVHDERPAGVPVAGGGGAAVGAARRLARADHVALDELAAVVAGAGGVGLNGQRGRLQRLGDVRAGGAGTAPAVDLGAGPGGVRGGVAGRRHTDRRRLDRVRQRDDGHVVVDRRRVVRRVVPLPVRQRDGAAVQVAVAGVVGGRQLGGAGDDGAVVVPVVALDAVRGGEDLRRRDDGAPAEEPEVVGLVGGALVVVVPELRHPGRRGDPGRGAADDHGAHGGVIGGAGAARAERRLPGRLPAVSSPATAPTTRRSSSASEAELVAGFTVGLGSAVAAPADEVSSAAATAAATPAAATGSPKRIRRL